MTTSMQPSAFQQKTEALLTDHPLAQAIALLKRANRYVGIHPSIGGQQLGTTITEFIAAYERRKEQQS
ncbi:hypothetical protein D3C78_1684690 [compost metagenome]